MCVRLWPARLFVRDNIKLIVFADMFFFCSSFRALKTARVCTIYSLLYIYIVGIYSCIVCSQLYT